MSEIVKLKTENVSVGDIVLDTTMTSPGIDKKIVSEKGVSAYIAEQISTVTGEIGTHVDSTSNPHSVTKTQVGLSNVVNLDLSTGAISYIIFGNGSAITTGIKDDIIIPFNLTINSITLLADQTGSIVVDIWKDTYENFPPTDSESITASATPTITTDIKSTDSTLTGWTKTCVAGDILRINVDSCTDIEKCTVNIGYVRT
jgi:hypothetical protein